MTEQDIVETRGIYRTKIERDPYAGTPDGDFFGSVYYLEDRGGHCELKASAYKSPDDFSDTIKFAWEQYRDMALVERYLRIWHGVRGFDYFETNSGKYVNTVTDHDLRIWGGWLEGEWPTNEDGTPSDPAEHNLDEWRAYHEGDVFGVVVEKATVWHTDDEDVPEGEREDVRWQEIDDTAVGGYYGEEWARQAATEALDDYAPRPCRKCGKPLKYDETAKPPRPWVHQDGDTSHEADGSVL